MPETAQEAIHKIVLKVDSQIIETMNLCPEKYRLQFVENWKPQVKVAPLEKGGLFHKMLEHYYRSLMAGRIHDSQRRAVIEECEMIGRVIMAKADTLSARDFERIYLPVFREYVLKYQYDNWDIIGVEEPFEKTLYDSDKLRIEYFGKVDLLVNAPGMGKCVIDTKTESQFRNPFQLNNQFQGYEWAFGCKVIINKIGLQVPKEKDDMTKEDEVNQRKARFRRLVHETGPHAIAEWRQDTIRQVIDSIGWHKDLEAGKRLRKNRASCDRFQGCEYQVVCIASDDKHAQEHKLTTNFVQGEPWGVGLEEPEEVKA